MMEHTRKITISSPNPKHVTKQLTVKKKHVGKKKQASKIKKKQASKIKKKQMSKTKQHKSLDYEIKKIMRIKEDDRTKWKKYQEVLGKFSIQPKKDILEHLPPRYKDRGVKFLDSLNGIVTWKDDGTTSVKGKELANSHIADLVEAYFDSSKGKPVGWDSFKQILPGQSEEKVTQWVNWPPLRSPKPRKAKHGKRTQ